MILTPEQIARFWSSERMGSFQDLHDTLRAYADIVERVADYPDQDHPNAVIISKELYLAARKLRGKE